MEITPGLKFNDIIELMKQPKQQTSYGIQIDGGQIINIPGRVLEIKNDLNQILVVNELSQEELPFNEVTHVMYKGEHYNATTLKDNGDLHQWWVCERAGK